MTTHLNDRVLKEMCDTVVDFLEEKGLDVKESSYLAQTLDEIQATERREWIKKYLSENVYFLLHGIIDQVYSLDCVLATSNPAVVSVAGHVLLRSTLDYGYKLAYLTVPEIGADERIKRAIEIYHRDMREYERLPPELKSESGQNRMEFVSEWYKEVSGGVELKRPIPVRSIFDAIGDPELEEWPRDMGGNPANPVYKEGYRIYSTVTHGNLWAIKHYGLTHVDKSGAITIALPGLDAEGKRLMQRVAGGLLQLSFGFAVQFMDGFAPSGIMNRMSAQIDSLAYS